MDLRWKEIWQVFIEGMAQIGCAYAAHPYPPDVPNRALQKPWQKNTDSAVRQTIQNTGLR